MGPSLNIRTGTILALCVVTASCGDPLVEPGNVAENISAPVEVRADSLPDSFDDNVIDRKPRKILSPDERRQVEILLKIYRDVSPNATSDDKDIAAKALDEIDPRIMKDERRREAALEHQPTGRTVADMIREYENKPTAP